MSTLRFALALSLGLSFGCWSKAFNEPGVVPSKNVSAARSYSNSYTDVWGATLTALQEKKYPVATSQRDSGVIVSDWVMGKSDRLYSGYGDTRIPYSVRYKISISLRPSRSGVDVSIKNEEQYYSDSVTSGTDFSGSLYRWLPTESSNAKEAALLDEIANQLKARKSGN